MRTIADAAEIDRLISDLAGQIRSFRAPHAKRSGVGSGGGATPPLVLVGIRRRGDELAARLGKRLGIAEVGFIDITLYRDDLSEVGAAPTVGGTSIPFNVDGADLVIVDDVLMTGRSILAAIREILDFGRPARIRLAVLVERPERELPIHPDHAALRLTPTPGENVQIRLRPDDGEDSICIAAR